MQCWAALFVIFWIEGHNAAPWRGIRGALMTPTCRSRQGHRHACVNDEGLMVCLGETDGVVLDAPFLQKHWYKLAAWCVLCTDRRLCTSAQITYPRPS